MHLIWQPHKMLTLRNDVAASEYQKAGTDRKESAPQSLVLYELHITDS